MTTFTCDGSFGAFSWSAVYNDQGPGTVTLEATGPGRCTVILQQEDLQRAAVYYIQPGGQRLPKPEGLQVAFERDVVIGAAPVEIRPARLDPFPAGPKPGAVGGFRTETYYSAT